jgi:hypothetical protein
MFLVRRGAHIAGCIDGNRKLYRWQSAKGYSVLKLFCETFIFFTCILRLPESRSLYGDKSDR